MRNQFSDEKFEREKSSIASAGLLTLLFAHVFRRLVCLLDLNMKLSTFEKHIADSPLCRVNLNVFAPEFADASHVQLEASARAGFFPPRCARLVSSVQSTPLCPCRAQRADGPLLLERLCQETAVSVRLRSFRCLGFVLLQLSSWV